MPRKKKNTGISELVLMGAANPRRARHDALWRQARSLLRKSKAKNPASRWAPARAVLTGKRKANPPGDRIQWDQEMVARLEESYRGLRKAGWSHADALRETLAQTTAGRGSIAEFKQRIKNPDWVQFKHEGFTYRTDGKIVEALDGKTWNRTGSLRIWQVAQEVFRKKNPDAVDKATELYEQFHGKEAEEVLELQESDTMRKTYTALGDLIELRVEQPDGGKLVCIKFTGDGVKVASAPSGRQLYLIGGDQTLDGSLDQFGTDATKDKVELGRAVYLMYRGRKAMDDFQLVDYYHELGEESGNPPIAYYDRLQKRIFFVGGSYHVEAPGIID